MAIYVTALHINLRNLCIYHLFCNNDLLKRLIKKIMILSLNSGPINKLHLFNEKECIQYLKVEVSIFHKNCKYSFIACTNSFRNMKYLLLNEIYGMKAVDHI